MGFKPNELKKEYVEKKSQSGGLPLFDDAPEAFLPDWVWNGREIQTEVRELLKKRFNHDSLVYLDAIIALGGQATDHEVKDYLRWDLHIVSARRNDLKRTGVIESFPEKRKPGPYGQANTIWFVNFKILKQRIEYGKSL